MDQRSADGWISGWSQIFAFYQRNSWTRLWVARRENCFSTEQNHPEHPLQEKGQSEGNESSRRRPFPSRKTDRLLDLRILPGHWSQWFCRELCRPIYNRSSKWWYAGIRFEMGRNSIVDDTNPTWWHLGRIVQIKNTSVWETHDRMGIVQYGDSSEEGWTWLSQIWRTMVKRSIEQNLRMKKFWSQKWKFWKLMSSSGTPLSQSDVTRSSLSLCSLLSVWVASATECLPVVVRACARRSQGKHVLRSKNQWIVRFILSALWRFVTWSVVALWRFLVGPEEVRVQPIRFQIVVDQVFHPKVFL